MTWKNQEKDPCENNQHQMKKNGTLDFDTERDGPTFFCLILEPPSFFSFLLLRLSDFQTSLNLSFFSLPKYNTPCETKLTHTMVSFLSFPLCIFDLLFFHFILFTFYHSTNWFLLSFYLLFLPSLCNTSFLHPRLERLRALVVHDGGASCKIWILLIIPSIHNHLWLLNVCFPYVLTHWE